MMKLKSSFKKLWRVISSTLLCVKYPFLYPRNRFTGKHYNNWKLLEYKKKLYLDSTIFISLDYVREFKEDIPSTSILTENYDYFLVIRDSGTGILRVLKYNWGRLWTIWKLDIGVEILEVRVDGKRILLKTEENPKTERRFFSITINPWKNMISKILGLYHDTILQILHFPTSHTELDFMEKGWKERFGLDFCRDLKKAIIKVGGYRALLRPWIMDIKEKWGQLEVYLVGYNEELSKVISKYQSLSKKTCIICGEEAKWESTGWISPYCNKCKPKNSVPIC